MRRVELLAYLVIWICFLYGCNACQFSIEHMYADDDAKDIVEGREGPPIVLQLAVNRKCSLKTGDIITLSGCKWDSLNNIPLYIEATSGWYALYKSDSGIDKMSINPKLRPARPNSKEFQSIFDSANIGYLSGRDAGTLSNTGLHQSK
eukprot:Tbor_TRINITY_DN5001_c0_g5::TRINITY_DN5001_c0_g5_i1::g.14421::m.14421